MEDNWIGGAWVPADPETATQKLNREVDRRMAEEGSQPVSSSFAEPSKAPLKAKRDTPCPRCRKMIMKGETIRLRSQGGFGRKWCHFTC